MIDDRFKSIFKKGSKTYYNSSYFFPPKIREKILILYSFVRTADDLIDAIPSQKEDFYNFRKDWETTLITEKSDNFIIQAFYNLHKELNFEEKWTEAFFDSMNMDLEEKKYTLLEDIETYIYGSAEVIGLYVSKILNLPEESMHGAMRLGKAMQYINFIRDIAEDNLLNRSYFPKSDFLLCNLKSLNPEYIFENQVNQDNFKKFINIQLERYFAWQEEAEQSFKYIPKRYLIPIKTASEMYKWTALKIQKDPIQVLSKKIKPRRYTIFTTAIKEIFSR